jgi:hypothetical protein
MLKGLEKYDQTVLGLRYSGGGGGEATALFSTNAELLVATDLSLAEEKTRRLLFATAVIV